MKYILLCVLAVTALLSSSTQQKQDESKARAEKQLQIEMEKEKKYSKEQTFYQSHSYDFKGAEVNPDSLDSLPSIEVQDDFDMDSVYD